MRLAWLKDLRLTDLPQVGGKNASLGEMIGALAASGIRVPGGFATTADAYREFLRANRLDRRIAERIAGLKPGDVEALARCGAEIRGWIEKTPLPEKFEQDIKSYYHELINSSSSDISFAVRSSATAEDLPDASFAGQQETFLNVRGIDQVLQAVRQVFASLYNDRAISYRAHHGFEHGEVALSAAVQQMVRSDRGASGVMFTLDTESGFRDVVFITAAYGLGEMVVQGAVNPDEFYVHKPMLERGRPAIVRRTLGSKLEKMIYADAGVTGPSVRTVAVAEAQRHRFSLADADVLELARAALAIEKHYRRPMDIEWGKDGVDGRIYVLQARPETVKSRSQSASEEQFRLKQRGPVLATGRAIGHKIGTGPVRLVADAGLMSKIKKGDVLVTDMTDPNWEPVMKLASAIVTNRGGRTCHAAIIARELGIPAVVGCGDATRTLRDGQAVTVSCAEGDTGNVYEGSLPFEVNVIERGAMPEIPVKITMNVGNPQLAFDFAQLPNAGVGLARMEFVINTHIKVHPMALVRYDALADPEAKRAIAELTRGYTDRTEYFVDRLARGLARIAAACYPRPVIV
ncbi:MAG: phosphoenolpyruvate synthase, partial [Burkholderiales bacterium]